MRWFLIFWVFLMGAISYLDRVNISIAGKWVQQDFKLTDNELGYVFSAFVWGYALFQALGGRLADRYGPRLVIGVGVLWWSLFTAATAWVPIGWAASLLMLVLVRFVLGLGEAVVFPASNKLVSTWIPTQERGLANGIIFAGVGAGAGVTPPLITWIITHWGWHWSFYISALIGVVARAWAGTLIARDKPQQHPWVKKEELAHIEAGLTVKASTAVGQAAPWGRILTNRNIWLITLSYFAYGYTAWIFFTWFFRYLNDVRGMDLKQSAVYAMLPFLAMALCSPLGGVIADLLVRRFGRWAGRCGIGVIGMGGAAICIALGTQVESAKLASLALALGRRHAVSVAEFLLGGDGRHRRAFRRHRLRLDEHGRPDRRRAHGDLDPPDRPRLGLDRVVPDARRAVRPGRNLLGAGQPERQARRR
jgi:ACS family glucarate transporter-like MFS transporter